METPQYLIKQAQAFESAIWAVTSGVSNDPLSRQRLRDMREHIYERARESGQAFAEFTDDEQHPTHAQFACGIRYAETEGEPGYHKVQLRQFIDANYNDDGTPIRQYDYVQNFETGKWVQVQIPHGTDSAIAAAAGFDFENVTAEVDRRLKKQGKRLRWRKKPGRKPLGDHVMSTAERVRKHRAAKKKV